MAATYEQPIICPVLIGRETYLASLQRCLDVVSAGAGRLLLLSGEAGIGKSRCAAEAKARCAAQGWRIAQGNCFESDHARPYGPLLDLLRGLAEGGSRLNLPDSLALAVPTIVRLLPELASQFPRLAPAPALDAEQEKRLLVDALAYLLKDLASSQPALVIIEDIHWCDGASLEFLAAFAHRLGSARILLALTYRADEVSAGLRHFLAEMDRARLASECALTALTPDGVDAMLQAIFQLDRPPRPDFVKTLYDLTEGNPFFIEESLKSLLVVGDIVFTDGAWDPKAVKELRVPRSARDAVQRRTELLSPAARELATLAAVVGQRFDFALMQRLTGRDEAGLLPLLKELIEVQLVVEVSADHFQFRHALTRQAIEEDLLARERRALSRAIAAAMEQLYADTLEAHLPELAYHFHEAAIWDRALEYARRAGERSLALFSPASALEHFTRALEAADQLGGMDRAALYLGRGKAYETLGDFDRARADDEAALEVARVAGDTTAEWQALLALGMLWAERDYTRTGAYYRGAHELARRMDDAEMLAESLNRVGNWHLNMDDPREAIHNHEQALAIFTALGSQRGMAESDDLLGTASLLHGEPARAAEVYDRAIAVWRERDERQMLSSSLAVRSACGVSYQTAHMRSLAPDPDHRRELEAAEEALRVAREIGWRAGEAFALFALSCVLAPRGELGRALAHAREALALAEEIGHRQWMAAARRGVGSVYFDLLALPEALDTLERGWALACEIDSAHWIRDIAGALALACVACGDFARARVVLTAAMPTDMPDTSLGQRSVWFGRAELALAAGDPPAALRMLERLGVYPVTRDMPGAPGARGMPYAYDLAGRALEALGRLDDAARTLAWAADVASGDGWRAAEWRIRAHLGALLRALHQQDAASSEITRARDLIATLARSIDDERQRDHFLRAALAQLPAPPAQPAAGVGKAARGALTPREREVAALVAQGLTNRAIAEALVLSERTVESHVTNILGKLGFTTRAQIAAWVAETRQGAR